MEYATELATLVVAVLVAQKERMRRLARLGKEGKPG